MSYLKLLKDVILLVLVTMEFEKKINLQFF